MKPKTSVIQKYRLNEYRYRNKYRKPYKSLNTFNYVWH